MSEANHPPDPADTTGRHRVVVVGSGFGGLFATRALRRSPVDVTLIARTPYHLFQPLLYQVATGILSEGEIAPSTREILRRQKNARVLLGDVTDVDLDARTVHASAQGEEYTVGYDSLIIAAGAGQSYFGQDQFAEFAGGMKSIDDALALRGRIFGAFELAEVYDDEATVRRLMTFVVVGAGPTGVEMAGQLAELAHRALPGDFRRINPRDARVVLLDAAPLVLPTFGGKLSAFAEKRLERRGVEVLLGRKVVGVDAEGIEFVDPDGRHERLEAVTKMWAAGVSASGLGTRVAAAAGAETDRAGRVHVNPDLTVPGHPEVFIVGDMIALDELPGVAQVAIQGGRYASREITRRLHGKSPSPPFHYHDKGSMATVSRFAAIAQIGPLRLTGILAWLLWLAVHLLYLVGFKNRVTAILHWAVSFLGRRRSERAGTTQEVLTSTPARTPPA